MNLIYTFPNLNNSVQVGDIAYYSPVSNNQSGTNHPTSLIDTKPRILGLIINVNYILRQITVDTNLGGGCGSCRALPLGPFILFQKDHRINTSGITGYFLNAEYRNYSRLPAEMFATAVDYAESSK